MIRSQVGDVKHSDLPGMEALGREGELTVSHNEDNS